MNNNFGSFSTSMITNTPADLNSERAKSIGSTLQIFADECVYVYSFFENKMLFARGWEAICGYADDAIGMLDIVQMTAPEFAPFAMELNDKALQFILSQTGDDLKEYSFSIELKKVHKNGTHIPIIAKVGVYSTLNGKLECIIGRWQVNRSLKFGKVMRYAAYGPDKNIFEEELDKQLFQYWSISSKEKEALVMAANGDSLKEIAHKQGVSQSAIEKRLIPMYRRFGVKSLAHLVSFAHENGILP